MRYVEGIRLPSRVSGWPPASPLWLLAFGFWPPASSFWLLAAGCFTRDSRAPSSHSRFPGSRRLTRDSWNRRLTRDFRIPNFSRKKIRKNRKNRFFGLPGPKSNFEIFMIFLYDQYFLYEPLFPSSQHSKTLKIESAVSKSTWGISDSSFRSPGTPFRPDLPPKTVFFRPFFAVVDLCSLYVTLS